MLNNILDYIFIPNGRCPVCKRVLFITNEFLCSYCKDDLPKVTRPCSNCGRELMREEIHYCSECLKRDYSFNQGTALYQYDGDVKNLIRLIKFYNSPALSVYLGGLLGEHLIKQPWINNIQLIIPVPLHSNRLEDRGYNQAEKIAKGVLTSLHSIPSLADISLSSQSLLRIKDNKHQINLHKSERFDNVKNIFKVSEQSNIINKNILLIDDVYTTGATIESCTRALLKGGAANIYCAVLSIGIQDTN